MGRTPWTLPPALPTHSHTNTTPTAREPFRPLLSSPLLEALVYALAHAHTLTSVPVDSAVDRSPPPASSSEMPSVNRCAQIMRGPCQGATNPRMNEHGVAHWTLALAYTTRIFFDEAAQHQHHTQVDSSAATTALFSPSAVVCIGVQSSCEIRQQMRENRGERTRRTRTAPLATKPPE